MKITIVADEKIPFLKGALEPFANVQYMDGRAIDSQAVRHADALLIRTRTRCDQSLLEGSQVQFIATATIGFDHIDAEYCKANGISWISAPGCNAASVEQYIASVLAGMAFRQNYQWSGKTMGVVGVGNVGRRVAILAEKLGMKVLLNDPPRARQEGTGTFVSLDTLLRESDIITLHVPLNRIGEDKTLHLIDEEKLAMVQEYACLINSSRGEVVDSSALYQALSAGRLGSAVLDVWEHEPLIDRQLLDKVSIATPHIAGYSVDGKRNGTVCAVRGLAGHFKLPLHEWEPLGIPGPAEPVILPESMDQPPEQLVSRAILKTYDVAEDDRRFRSNPGNFEYQRNNYPARREFPAYQVLLCHPHPKTLELIHSLGFQIK